VVDLIPSSVDPTLPLENEFDTTHIFLVNTDSTIQGGISHFPMEPPPSNEAIIFDWNGLTRPRLPFYIPFQIIVQVCGRDAPQNIVDDIDFVSILSSSTWKYLGYPQLVSITKNLLGFNKRTIEPSGILPQFPITLGGKFVYIDVMVVHEPLDFSLLLGRDYVYAMKDIVSTLFRVISFPHNGKIMTIDQLSFVGPDLTAIHLPSLNGPYMSVVSPPPHINYVATCPIPFTTDENESLTIRSTSYDLDDMVISLIGLLEPNLPTPIKTLDMYSFHSVVLPSNKYLLEAMIEVCPLT
jgi:hypothetical protein